MLMAMWRRNFVFAIRLQLAFSQFYVQETTKMTSESMIEVDGLTKYYGDFPAVSGLTFSVRKGEILGFLGPNGAGKSLSLIHI